MSTLSCDIKKALGSTSVNAFPYISNEDYPAVFGLEESKETWYEFYKKIKELHLEHRNYMHDSYLEGLESFAFSESSIPSLSTLSNCLKPWGWHPIWINGYVPARVYAALIARGYFPVACVMRRKVFLEHSPIPDFIHDVWGHLPLLCNKNYSQYLKEIATAIENAETNKFDQILYESEVKAAYLQHEMVPSTSIEVILAQLALSKAQEMAEKFPSQQMQLARMFLWSVEFGLLEQSKSLKIVGAGILSAPLEFINIVEGKIKIKPYSSEVINYGLTYFSDLQPEFFTINHFDSWRDILTMTLKKI